MKIFTVILLIAVSGCSSQSLEGTAKVIQKEAVPTLGDSHSEVIQPRSLKVGTWEGINNSGASFEVLTINADGNHSIISYYISSGMQHKKTTTFSNKDISCDDFTCQIMTVTASEELPLKILLTERVEKNYLVTEVVKLKSGEISSNRYELFPIKGKSTPERFLLHESEEVADIASKFKNQRFGYWGGVLESVNDDQLKLVTLKYLPEQIATFTVYYPGTNLTADMTFHPKWLVQDKGELQTKLEGSLFASKLTLRYVLRDVINGDYEQRFERYPEKLIDQGHFRLTRMGPSNPKEPPAWLKKFLEGTQ